MSRQLTASSHFRSRLGRIVVGKAVGQFAHHLGAFRNAHAGPSSNLVDRAATAVAQARASIKSTNFGTRCLDHGLSRNDHKHSWPEGNCAIVAMSKNPSCSHGIAACGPPGAPPTERASVP